MAQKYKPMKIKRSKGRLYKKRKSGGRKAAEIIILVLVVGGLVFLGYTVAGPVIRYFQNGSAVQEQTDQWKPEESTSQSESSEVTSGQESTSSDTAEPTTQQPQQPENTGSAALGAEALSDYASFAAALDKAKADGAGKVYIPAKDLSGKFLYDTEIAGLDGSDADTGKLTTAQILSAAKSSGVELIAVVPAFRDYLTPGVLDETAYRFADNSSAWLDGRPENGGKRRLDPFRQATKDYFKAVAAELKSAGFSEIVLSEMIYPQFLPYDTSILEGKFFADDRYKALSEIVASAASAGVPVRIEASLKDVLSGYGKDFGGTAELLKDKNIQKNNIVNITFTKSDFGNKLDIGDGKTVNLSTNITERIITLYKKAKEYLPDCQIVPVINPDGLTGAELASVKAALSGVGFGEVIIGQP